jgi:hypothetical protein
MLINPIIQSKTRYFHHTYPHTRDNKVLNDKPLVEFILTIISFYLSTAAESEEQLTLWVEMRVEVIVGT